MNTLKKICNLLDIHCEDIQIKDVSAMLVNGKVYFPDTVLNTAEGRDILHRAYLKYTGLNEDKYYKAMYEEIRVIR